MCSTISEYGHEGRIPNVCRCCLSNDCFGDISKEYLCSVQKEGYQVMLSDTFNIQMNPVIDINLICERCIFRLKDASAFKQTVLKSEETLLKHHMDLKSGNHTEASLEKDVKAEFVKTETSNELNGVNINEFDDAGLFYSNASTDDDDEILANIKMEIKKSDQLPTAPSVKRKRHERLGVRKKARVKEDSKLDIVTEKKKTKVERDWLKISERRGNGPLLRANSLKLLANSTMCVFQWNKSRYRCFSCMEPFSDVNLLKEHTASKHTLQDIEKKIILQQNRLVKVEVSSLYCKICSTEMVDINGLKQHLVNSHDVKFDLDEDLLVPFKIVADLKCQICSLPFTMFRLLNMHMNKHYQKQVCHICGAGFSNLVFLNLHKTRSHRPLNCRTCNVIFTNKSEKKNHDMTVHNVKFERKLRFPCPYCKERFYQENFRVLHLVEKHGIEKPEHRCRICSKAFITRSLCNNHVKNVHMKEKNQECDICHNLFYTKSDVVRHKVTHTGEKKYSCGLCSNLFATKDSLRRHMKRTHIGIK